MTGLNLGFGYDLMAGFLQTDGYYGMCLIAYAVLFISPFILWNCADPKKIFVACTGIAFTVIKLLSLYLPIQNPDEGQHLLMAWSLIDGGVPFKDFEGQGHGPLNALYLALFSFGEISLVTGRLASLFAELGCAVLTFFAVRKLCGVRPAMVLSIPVFFYFSIYSFDVIAYNNETLFCLLISLWFVLFVYRGQSRGILFAEFLVLGLLPWCKLQFAPFSAVCFVLSFARGIFVHGCEGSLPVAKPEKVVSGDLLLGHLLSKNTLLAGAAAALPSVLLLAYVALNGALSDFFLLYIKANVQHVEVPFIGYLERFGGFLLLIASQRPLFWVASCTAVTFVILALANIRSSGSSPIAGVSNSFFRPMIWCIGLFRRGRLMKTSGTALLVLFVVTVLFATTRTLHSYDHYVHILVPSSAIFVALGMSLWTDEKAKRSQQSFAILTVAVLIFGIKLMTLSDTVRPGFGHVVSLRNAQQNGFMNASAYPFRYAVPVLNERVKPGVPIAIWGWETGFSIYSGHPSATATHFAHVILNQTGRFSSEISEQVRDKYIRDIIGAIA